MHWTTHNATAAAIAVCFALITSGCSSADADDLRMSDLDLTKTEVGCEVEYGNEPVRVVGPIRRADTAVVELSEDSKALIGNSPMTLHITINRGLAKSSVAVNYADIPNSGYVMDDSWIDSAHPGYRITCRRG